MIRTESDGRRWCPHAPGANLDYSVNWGATLAPGEQLFASEWTADAGITLTQSSISPDKKTTTVYAGGGVARQNYVLTNKIVTNAGRVDSRTITLRCGVR